MSKLFKQALFVIPVAVIIAAPVVFKDKIKDWSSPKVTVANDNNSGLAYLNPFSSTSYASTIGKKDYSMMEPFASNGMNAMSYAMKRSMDPSTWMSIMMGMMNPHQTSPIAMCANCHQGEELTRYQQSFGPIMQSMWTPYQNMMNPMIMNQMMHQMNFGTMQSPAVNTLQSPMNPKEYEKWYNEQQEKLNERK